MEDPERERPALERAILHDTIDSLRLGPAISVPRHATLQQAIEPLHIGCVLVVGADGWLDGDLHRAGPAQSRGRAALELTRFGGQLDYVTCFTAARSKAAGLR